MIDPGIGQPWPDPVLDAVKRFKQGDLIEWPPIFYAAISAYAVHDQTRAIGDPSMEVDLIPFSPENSPPYGLITTQTCDLCEESPKPKQPWIHIVPVYSIDIATLRQGQQHLIENHRIGHLVPLTGTALPRPGLWVADLRLEVPLEKSMLVGRQPIEAFDAEDGYHRLASRLAGRRERPALAPVISEHIVKSLRELLGSKKVAGMIDDVRDLRLYVSPTRLAPISAQLLIITHQASTDDVRGLFDGWWSKAEVAAGAAGLNLLGNRYETLRTIDAQEYVDSIPLDFTYLSPDL